MIMQKYVVLEHLQLPNRGVKFWTTNTENNTHSAHGELWYKEVHFTDDETEAIEFAREWNYTELPSHRELENYWAEQIKQK